MADAALPPQTLALQTELRRVREQEASQQRLLEILQLELTGLCEQFCEDLNNCAQRLDEARLLLSTALASQTELEAEVERHRDAFSQLHWCAQELALGEESWSQELASTLSNLVQFGSRSDATQYPPLDRQECMQFLRQEPKWWSLEDVLNKFEDRVNAHLEASMKRNLNKDVSMGSQVPLQMQKEAAGAKNAPGIITAGKMTPSQVQPLMEKGLSIATQNLTEPQAPSVAHQLTEASMHHLQTRAGTRTPVLGRSTIFSEMKAECPSHTEMPIAKRIPQKSKSCAASLEQKTICLSDRGSQGSNVVVEEAQRYLYRKPASTRKSATKEECRCRLCLSDAKPHHDTLRSQQPDCEKDHWEEKKFWPRCVREPFKT